MEQNQPSTWRSFLGSPASAEVWLFPGSDSKPFGVYQHERYLLRKIDIGFCILGIILNSVYIGLSWDPTSSHFIALLPLCLSTVWDLADLASPGRIFKQGVPLGLLAFGDSLAFLCFLALIIVNGQQYSYYWYNKVVVVVYATIRWMASSAIHGFVALKTLWCWARWVDPNNSHEKMATCPDCKRRWKNVPEDPPAGEAADRDEHYSLLGDEGVDHEDVEATVSS